MMISESNIDDIFANLPLWLRYMQTNETWHFFFKRVYIVQIYAWSSIHLELP